MTDYLIVPDFDPEHQNYGVRILRRLGHLIGTWRIKQRENVSGQYSGYNHIGDCKRCNETFRITVYSNVCDLFAWDGLVVTYPNRDPEKDNLFDHRIGLYRKYRNVLVCNWVKTML